MVFGILNNSYRDKSVVVAENNSVVELKCKQYNSLNKMLSKFSKVLMAYISSTAVLNNRGIGKCIGGFRWPRFILHNTLPWLVHTRCCSSWNLASPVPVKCSVKKLCARLIFSAFRSAPLSINPLISFLRSLALDSVFIEENLNKGGKFLKKLWCCVSGRV